MCLFLLAGCYTQFAHRERMLSGQYIPPDSVMTSDSMRANIPDTLRVNNNQHCYWTRDIYGKPELRCDDAYYGQDWYRYNNSPWWNSSSSYYYGDYNYNGWDQPCPAFYYWDNSCGACVYYSNFSGHRDSWWWNSGSGYGSSSSSSKTSAPLRSRYTRTEGIPTASERATGTSTSSPKSQTASPAAGSEAGSGETGITESRSQRARTTRSEGIPTASERSSAQNTDAAASALNRQLESDRSQQTPVPQENIQQQSPPSQPPQGNVQPQSAPAQNSAPPQQDRSGQDNSSGNSSRARGNSRGY